MREDRLQILAMLKEGKISVDEASQLLEAMELDREGSALTTNVAPPAGEPTVIRIENEVGGEGHSAESPLAGAFLPGARLDGALLDGANLHGA
ncbi:MAG: pentapeptide repeat-containing protein, partial [Caldilineaceae bacterium]|nr:pentapeptide repeat-containing protein [Caldilineaceae bacterium]